MPSPMFGGTPDPMSMLLGIMGTPHGQKAALDIASTLAMPAKRAAAMTGYLPEGYRWQTPEEESKWMEDAALGFAGSITPKVPPMMGRVSRPVRPASEDVGRVLDATFKYGAMGGNKTMPIEKLTGSLSSAADTAAKVDRLAETLRGPNSYISRLIVDDAGHVIEGQHRLAALRKLGEKDVPVTVIRDLSRGVDVAGIETAVRAAGKLHPDQVKGVVQNTLEMVAEAGSPAKALATYELPRGFEQFFRAALEKMGAK